ncbi:hypothetical protein R0381_001770 [Jeongeupia wiesaeckerbachi]|uniref:hypothetical protein n=1 Tax=Jeongeupia wiesaeckerbachi TaxID=3051218 RepID=UPI003D809700
MTRDEVAKKLHDVTPAHLEAYLFENGWVHDGDISELASIWHRPEPKHVDVEVLLPRSKSARDFKERIIDALMTLAAFEERSPIVIMKAAIGHLADLVRIRVFHNDVNEGTIPINDGVLLNLRARDLMASAAMSTTSKRRYFSGKRSPEAIAFIDSLRLGQTEVGSYIVNIIAPTSPASRDQQSLDTVPLSNIVTANLTTSLDALMSAIDKFAAEGNLAVFDEAVACGASANMCDALIGLSGTEKKRGFEISITPSRNHTYTSQVKTFRFDVEKVGRMADASAYYKDNYVLPAQTILGTIKRLDRPLEEEIGTVTIAATVGGMEKHVSIQLGPDEYLDAVNAHKQKSAVQCTGDLHVSARAAKMLNPTGFKVLTSGELFP